MYFQEWSALDEAVADIQASIHQIEKEDKKGETKKRASDSENESSEDEEEEEGEIQVVHDTHHTLLLLQRLCQSVLGHSMTTPLGVIRS